MEYVRNFHPLDMTSSVFGNTTSSFNGAPVTYQSAPTSSKSKTPPAPTFAPGQSVLMTADPTVGGYWTHTRADVPLFKPLPPKPATPAKPTTSPKPTTSKPPSSSTPKISAPSAGSRSISDIYRIFSSSPQMMLGGNDYRYRIASALSGGSR